MRKVDDGEKEKKRRKKRKKKKKRMAFLVATTSLPAVYCPNGYARTTTAGTPHARAKSEEAEKEIYENGLVGEWISCSRAERGRIKEY